MNIQVLHKQIELGDFNLNYLFYKNINIKDFSVLTDQVSELLFSNKLSIQSHVINVDLNQSKIVKKAEKKTFGEVNWSTKMLPKINQDNSVSGYYIAIGGATVKTIAASNFIAKIIEVADKRWCFANDIYSDANSTKGLRATLDSLMLFTGYESKHIVKAEFLLNKESFVNKGAYLNIVDLNSAHHSIAPFFLEGNSSLNIRLLKQQDDLNNVTEIKNENVLKTNFKSAQLLEIGVEAFGFKDLDIQNQIIKTIQSYTDYLKLNDFTWKNMVRCVVYLDSVDSVKLFKNYCKENQIPFSVIIPIESKFCLENNLFRMEADFAKNANM